MTIPAVWALQQACLNSEETSGDGHGTVSQTLGLYNNTKSTECLLHAKYCFLEMLYMK